jgi:DegV family protein with EDD domain
MRRVAIVTDSAACIPKALVEELDIRVVPFRLIWSGVSFLNGLDLSPSQFYRRLEGSKELPTTSQPTIDDFEALYRELSLEVEAILSIHVPKEMSGTIGNARTAAGRVSSVPIRVVDGRTAVSAQGFVVVKAARTVAAGKGLDEVEAAAQALIPRVRLLATLDTLEYIRRSGRINDAVALLGSVFQIKPIICFEDGLGKLFARVRTRERAFERMLAAAVEGIGPAPGCVAVFHANAPERAEELLTAIQARVNCVETWITEFTPVMGAHTGPGVLGVSWYAEE